MPETNSKPNILYVFGGEKAQGAEIVIGRLMAQMASFANIHLILSPGKFADDLLSANKPYKINTIADLKKLNRSSASKAQYYFRGFKNYLTVSQKINKYIRDNKITIIHANTIVPASYLIPVIAYTRLFNPSLKWYWSDHDLKYFTGIDIRLSKLCAKLYNATLVVSNAVKNKYGVNNKVLVLYNGLDINKFKPDVALRNMFRSKWNLDDHTIVIGIAASINPDKGHLELIKVFNKIQTIIPDIRLILAGDFASHFPEYKALVEQEIIRKTAIIYAGFINNMIEFYNGCDLIVNNSNNYRSESLGTTIYEAMACEKLVVASDTGGNPEIITDGVDGILFKTDNIIELEEKLVYAIKNHAQLANMRYQARKKAETKFNILTMVQNYRDIISI